MKEQAATSRFSVRSYGLACWRNSARNRRGVIGSSVTAPAMPIASSIAAAIAAPTALIPPSPAPFNPIGLSGLGASSEMMTLDRGNFPHRWHQIVGECDRQRLAAIVVEKLFQQRATQALGHATRQLSLHQHRIDRLADVEGNQVAQHFHRTGFPIHLHHGGVHAVRVVHMVGVEPALGRKPGRTVAQRLRCRRQMAGHVAERDGGARRGVRCEPLCRRQYRANPAELAATRPQPRSPWRELSGRARRAASPVMTVTREAKAPMPCAIRSVWPCTTRMRR